MPFDMFLCTGEESRQLDMFRICNALIGFDKVRGKAAWRITLAYFFISLAGWILGFDKWNPKHLREGFGTRPFPFRPGPVI